jgi:hypothetical protein
MKKLFGLLLSFIVGIGALMSCSTTPYTVKQSVNSALLEQKTVFLDVVLMQRNFPVLPIVDAGMYRASVEGGTRSSNP